MIVLLNLFACLHPSPLKTIEKLQECSTQPTVASTFEPTYTALTEEVNTESQTGVMLLEEGLEACCFVAG